MYLARAWEHEVVARKEKVKTDVQELRLSETLKAIYVYAEQASAVHYLTKPTQLALE